MFFEALALAALFSECKSVREFTFKKYGKEKVYFLLNPVLFENTEKNMKFLESCSECPILIDLTAKCIYRSVGAKTGKRLRRIPSIKNISVRNIDEVFYRSKVPYDHADMTEVLKIFKKSKELWRHLSSSTVKLLENAIMQDGNETKKAIGKAARSFFSQLPS